MILQTSCVQLVRADRHCQPPEQHFRVQGLQEQNSDISGKNMETTLFFLKMPTWFRLLILRWSFLMPPSCSSRSWCRWTLLQGSWSNDLLVNSVGWIEQFATRWPTEPIKQCEAHLSFLLLVVLFLIPRKVTQYLLLLLGFDMRCVSNVLQYLERFANTKNNTKNKMVDASHLLLRQISSAYVTSRNVSLTVRWKCILVGQLRINLQTLPKLHFIQ